MALMNWENKYSVGVAAMDAQHQKWFGILNRLHEAMLAGQGEELQRSILSEMAAYTNTYFLQEEPMLKMRGYPELAEHREKHVAFTRKVQALEAKVLAGSSVLTVEVMDFLRDWLSQHILSVDTKYGAWLKAH